MKLRKPLNPSQREERVVAYDCAVCVCENDMIYFLFTVKPSVVMLEHCYV